MSDGSFSVYSPRTGIVYCVEPVAGGVSKTWDVGGVLTDRSKGSVSKSDSKIVPESGFKNIVELPPGTSPHGEIERVDAVRYEQGFRPKSPPDKGAE